MGDELLTLCRGTACGFGAIGRDVGCTGGDGSCWSANFITADESVFHPSELQEATERIKEILDRLVSRPDGRKLSFIHTPFGTLLAWVKHGQPFATGAVTSANTPEEIAEALGLIVDTEQPAQRSEEHTSELQSL